MRFVRLAILSAFLLSGCASAPPLDFSPVNVGMSRVKHDAALVSTSVTAASKADRKGPIELASALVV